MKELTMPKVQDVSKFNEANIQRTKNLAQAVKPIMQTINAENLLEPKNWERGFSLFRNIAENRLKQSTKTDQGGLFKNITDNNRWRILNYAIKCDLSGEFCYKENIVTQPWNRASSKTVYKIIDEFIDSGIFIYMTGYKNVKHDNRKKNIKPSEQAVIEWVDWHVHDLRYTIELIKEYTKIKVHFS